MGFFRYRLRGVTLASLLLFSAVPIAHAQDLGAPDAPSKGRAKLDGVCSASIERFCPSLVGSPGQTRSQVICLKPYRTSLPLPCRRAVTAAMK